MWSKIVSPIATDVLSFFLFFTRTSTLTQISWTSIYVTSRPLVSPRHNGCRKVFSKLCIQDKKNNIDDVCDPATWTKKKKSLIYIFLFFLFLYFRYAQKAINTWKSSVVTASRAGTGFDPSSSPGEGGCLGRTSCARVCMCVYVHLVTSKDTLMWVWAGTRFRWMVGELWGRGEGGGVLAFESADFFMDQTYFSVCYYVIIKAM